MATAEKMKVKQETEKNSNLEEIKEAVRSIELTFDDGEDDYSLAHQDVKTISDALVFLSNSIHCGAADYDEALHSLSLILILLSAKLDIYQESTKSDLQEIMKNVHSLEAQEWISNPLND